MSYSLRRAPGEIARRANLNERHRPSHFRPQDSPQQWPCSSKSCISTSTCAHTNQPSSLKPQSPHVHACTNLAPRNPPTPHTLAPPASRSPRLPPLTRARAHALSPRCRRRRGRRRGRDGPESGRLSCRHRSRGSRSSRGSGRRRSWSGRRGGRHSNSSGTVGCEGRGRGRGRSARSGAL